MTVVIILIIIYYRVCHEKFHNLLSESAANMSSTHAAFSGYRLLSFTAFSSIARLRRYFSQTPVQSTSRYFIPPSSADLPRPAGITSAFRLPVIEVTEGIDICLVGVPIDIGTSNRSGTRFGPRQIREMSTFVGRYNSDTGAAPFESLQVADAGDVYINLYDLKKSVQGIKNSFEKIIHSGCKTIALGGDHTITYPILQAIKDKYGPVGLIHVDAHDDTADMLSGEKVTHGTTFRRAGEEGCLDMRRVVQIGLRGLGHEPGEDRYGTEQGFRVVRAKQCWHKSLTPLMEEVRQQMGNNPVYISFDIDAIDPAFCPGTGTPEIAGLTTIQALEIIRGCRGLNIIGCDLVEVSPPYDPQGMTALTAANLIFEMLCIFPGVRYYEP